MVRRDQPDLILPKGVTPATSLQFIAMRYWLPKSEPDEFSIDGRATAYVCRDYACRLPVHTAAELKKELSP